MMEAARTSVTSVDNYFTRQYIPEDKSELHTRRRENLISQKYIFSSLHADIHRVQLNVQIYQLRELLSYTEYHPVAIHKTCFLSNIQ
jgi:hypothetical protein